MKGPRYKIGSTVLADWCPHCYGEGRTLSEDDPLGIICVNCEGNGMIVTEAGSELLAFVNDMLLANRKENAHE